jgi:hypothetical protein
MRVTNNLTDRYFNTEIRDERFHWVARALHPDTGRLLGFIKFFKKKGTIEVTNFDAQLHRRSLNFGGGDKSSNPHLAGGKGEGYKAAAAVALAEGYQYRYEASSCYWKFHIGGKNDPEQIYCELKPMRQNALANVIASYEREVITASSRNEEKSYIHKDVTVKIGKVYQSKVFPGVSITEEVFLECIKVSLDLVPPTDIVKTDFGDLILDDESKTLPISNIFSSRVILGYPSTSLAIISAKDQLIVIEEGDQTRQTMRHAWRISGAALSTSTQSTFRVTLR